MCKWTIVSFFFGVLFFFGLHHVRQNVDGKRENDRGVLLRRNRVQSLKKDNIFMYFLQQNFMIF